MSNQEEVAQLYKLLAIHRKTLETLLEQQATHTKPYTPPSTVQGIHSARLEIRQIKTKLQSWGIPVEDHVVDAENSAVDPSNIGPNVPLTLPTYLEDFTHRARYWPIGTQSDSNKIIRSWLENGAYRLEIKNISGYSTGIDSLIPEVENFDLETSIRLISAADQSVFAINFGLNNKRSVYNIGFREDGCYRITAWDFINHTSIYIQNWSMPISLNDDGINNVRLKVLNKMARLYINGDDVYGQDIDLGDLYGKGRIGLGITIKKDTIAIIEMLAFKLTILPNR